MSKILTSPIMSITTNYAVNDDTNRLILHILVNCRVTSDSQIKLYRHTAYKFNA